METLQNRRLLSLLTDTSVLPFGVKARGPIPCVCPLHVPISLPVLVSHRRIAFSASSGLHEAAKTAPSCETTTAQGTSVLTSKSRIGRRVFASQTAKERSLNATKTSAAILTSIADGSFRFHHLSEFGSVETTSDEPSGEILSDRKGISPIFRSLFELAEKRLQINGVDNPGTLQGRTLPRQALEAEVGIGRLKRRFQGKYRPFHCGR